MDMDQKDDPDSENRKLYIECLGQLAGITFKPGSDLQEIVPHKHPDELASPEAAETDTYVVHNTSTQKSKNWKPGALIACMRKLGFDPNGKKVMCADPLKPTPQEILPSFIYPQPKNAPKNNESHTACPSFKRNIDSLNGNQNDNLSTPGNRKRIRVSSEGWTSTNSGHNQSQEDTQGLFTTVASLAKKNNNQHPNNHNQPNGRKRHASFSETNAQSDEEMETQENNLYGFQTARSALILRDKAKGIKRDLTPNPNPNPPYKRPAGFSGMLKSDLINLRKKFIDNVEKSDNKNKKPEPEQKEGDAENNAVDPELAELLSHPQLKNFDAKLVASVLSEVMQPPQVTTWKDIAGLKGPKKIINEVIIWPILRPEIFNGLRAPAKGILLFGPPGTGKTMIGRVIASQSKSTFFNISASSLTSKWIGEGEKLVRCLFQLARIKQPSVVFIDEIDSILTSRSDTEHESSRRMKTEFLVQFDGCGTDAEDRVLVIGVTNRPQELDEAARRRLVKKIYIPLPDVDGRIQIVKNLMAGQRTTLSEEDFIKIGEDSEGFSGADMKSLCQDASYGPIREIIDELETITPERVRDISIEDFDQAFKQVKSSVAQTDLTVYEEWDAKFGSHARQ